LLRNVAAKSKLEIVKKS